MRKRSIRHIGKEQFVQRVRYVGNLTIYFRKKDEIVITDGNDLLLCERWWENRGFYSRSWRPFAEALTKNNSLVVLSDVFRLVNKYGISTHAPGIEKLDIPKDVVILATHYDDIRRKK